MVFGLLHVELKIVCLDMMRVKVTIKEIPEHWILALLSEFAVTLLAVSSYFETGLSIDKTGVCFDTFEYGFLIISISLWLIWLLADLTQVKVIKQYAVVVQLVSAI